MHIRNVVVKVFHFMMPQWLWGRCVSLSRPICSGGHNNTDELCVWRAELMDFPARGKRKRSFRTALPRNLPFIMMLLLLIVDKVATVKVRLCLTTVVMYVAFAPAFDCFHSLMRFLPSVRSPRWPDGSVSTVGRKCLRPPPRTTYWACCEEAARKKT